MNNPRRRNGYKRDELNRRHKALRENCHICGGPIDYDAVAPSPWSYVTDEIVPVKYGGDPLSWDNTAPAHWWCNRIKSTHSIQWARAKVRELIKEGKAPSRRAPESVVVRSSDWFGR
ncbi:hypothetical protein [Bifidobacterium sp. SO4]|uniref:HNH endonuclease n=1 Tax=Bifidobacterium sp. SO4 TaxID=2809030 RepID=UPI001F0A8A73|nr:hypothetical protein [Bifidobacterium sp. SO4]